MSGWKATGILTMEFVYIARDIGRHLQDIIAGIPVIATNTGTGEDDINKKTFSHNPGIKPGLFFYQLILRASTTTFLKVSFFPLRLKISVNKM